MICLFLKAEWILLSGYLDRSISNVSNVRFIFTNSSLKKNKIFKANIVDTEQISHLWV